ncbi:hypothetical protein BJ741DRAFT_585150 [Chytriomyces cf. hyalinus JEL632]|nr:hypothetical protein BJ741DRAFT_585150 [Chytriomyces cf. hyalinus JEL632]
MSQQPAALFKGDKVSCVFYPVVLDELDVQYFDVSEGEFRMVTEVMGVLVNEVVAEVEVWDAWALLGGVDGQELPNVPCEMIGDIMIARRADAMAKRMHEEEETLISKGLPPSSASYPQPPSSNSGPVPPPRPPRSANYPRVILTGPCPEPAAPKSAPAPPKPAAPSKPAAKCQYKKSLEMASIDLDKQMVKILSNTEVKLTALDLITFSAAFCKKVNEISKTHHTSINKAMGVKEATAAESGTVCFLQPALPVSIGSFAEEGSTKNQLLMQKLFRKGGNESTMPSAVIGLL